MHDDNDFEARRIAGELRTAQQCGYITGPDDPEARFLARVFHLFGATLADY